MSRQDLIALLDWRSKTDPIPWSYSPIIGYCPDSDGRMGVVFADGTYLPVPKAAA